MNESYKHYSFHNFWELLNENIAIVYSSALDNVFRSPLSFWFPGSKLPLLYQMQQHKDPPSLEDFARYAHVTPDS